jgi:hypothetical protein
MKGQGKHMMKKGRLHIKNESRFYALLVVILGIASGFIFKAIGEIDITGPIFLVLFGLLGYIGTFVEDE